MKILYIANNIPLPKQKSNRIVLSIAEKLSPHCDISFVFPAAIVFPPFSFLKKYRPLNRLKPWTDGNFSIVPVRYIRLPGKRLSYLLMDSIHPEKYVDENALPDLCHAHYIMPDGYIAYKIKQKYGIPYVVSVRGGDLRHIKTLHSKEIVFKKFIAVLENADKIVVHNRPQQEFVYRLGFESVLIPHGIDSKMLNFCPKKNNTIVTVSVVADHIRQKNIHWVIQAVKAYHNSQNIELLIAGDGTYKNELQKIAGNAANIRFFGKIPHKDVLEILEKSHIFALPSVNETFGLVYLEAAANCCAVICHKNEGVDGVFDDDKEMVFCQGYDDFNALLTGLIDNAEKREKMAEESFVRVRNNYTWEMITDRYLKTYNEIIIENKRT